MHMLVCGKQWFLAKGDDFQITRYNQLLPKTQSRRQQSQYFKSHFEDRGDTCHFIVQTRSNREKMHRGVKWNKTGINLGKEIEVIDRTKGTWVGGGDSNSNLRAITIFD